jgi:asparagine synthase (glutamine-hydrolysing)
MSALLAIVGPKLPADAVVRRMLGAMQSRGADRAEVWRAPDAVLAVTRAAWQMDVQFAGETLVLDAGDCVVIADASIFYRADLCRALSARGVAARVDMTSTELVLSAYRAWGAAAAEHIEGDFAFIVWDRRTKQLTASRDYGGKRTLYFAELGGTLVIASLLSGVVEHPACPTDLNLPVLAETFSQFWMGGDDTVYAAVRELMGARTLSWSPGGSARVSTNWEPPAIAQGRASSFEDGAAELRQLLMNATSERFARDGMTAVWMSGGWDSPSVFGAGQAALQKDGRGRELRPVSISYPVGDPGREDELITAISNHWQSPIEWIDVDAIPLLDRPVERAAERDGPYAHTYEHWNRALAQASRAAGARVAFDGNGGDQLFAVSDVYLSDLFREGRWFELAREWRRKGGGTRLKPFLEWAVVPAMPLGLVRGVQRLRGRARAHYLERAIPTWVPTQFSARHQMRERDLSRMPARAGEVGWRREAYFYLASPVFPRAFSNLGAFAMESGVELRSPLHDRRIIEFACARPREERNSGRETKRMLRASMQGLLPDHVLAPRRFRTGITSSYSDRQMRASFPPLMHYLVKDSILGELGVIDPSAIRANWDRFTRTGNNSLKIPLFLTLQAELWLRARLRPEQLANPANAPTRVPASVR